MISGAAARAALGASTDALVAGLERAGWRDADVRAPSLLVGWSRGHVLTHVARNADGITRTVAGALRGEVVMRYPSGRAGRDADIEAGAGRGFAELVRDVRESAQRLDAVFDEAGALGAWDRPTEDRTVGEYVVARWREVEVHRVDLGGEYGPADWPPAFVSYLLPELIDALEQRVSEPVRIEVIAAGSVHRELAGRTYEVGDAAPHPVGDASAHPVGDPSADPVARQVVAGPDWAVLAWLTGRSAAAGTQLSAAPELAPWI